MLISVQLLNSMIFLLKNLIVINIFIIFASMKTRLKLNGNCLEKPRE